MSRSTSLALQLPFGSFHTRHQAFPTLYYLNLQPRISRNPKATRTSTRTVLYQSSMAKKDNRHTYITRSPPPSFPVRFYAPTNPASDARGRNLSSGLSWPASDLERSHDYIQNLFPLPENSAFNLNAPVIDEQTFTAFRSSPELQHGLRKSLIRMLHFYGLELSNSSSTSGGQNPQSRQTYEVHPGPNFVQGSRYWLTKFNHNHLRITRIIRSCRVLGLGGEAKAFYDALIRVAQENKAVISQRTLMFWQRAAERPLYLPPDMEEGEDSRKDWLWRVEHEDGEVAADRPFEG